MRRGKTSKEVADLIERFISDTSLYPQEWNDFIECRQQEPELDVYRKRCEILDPLVNSPGIREPGVIAELRRMIAELRQP